VRGNATARDDDAGEVQRIGRAYRDQTLLRAGAAYQSRTTHHLRVPALAAASVAS